MKQYCLLNGIAVMEVNNFIRDGWESWGDIWNGGYDPPFFAALVDAMLGRPHRSGRLPPSEWSHTIEQTDHPVLLCGLDLAVTYDAVSAMSC